MKKAKTKQHKMPPKQEPTIKRNAVLGTAALLILLFVVGGYLYNARRAQRLDFMARENASTFVRDYSMTLGSDDARVYLVEFFDPACETCRDFYPMVKGLLQEHQGKVKLVARYAPFHQGSDHFVKILEASRKQGKYWETLELMYNTQHYWAAHHQARSELIMPLLSKAGLNMERLVNDMNDPEIAKRIEQDLADVNTLGVRKTPEFFVNGKPLSTFGYTQLKTLVEDEIAAKY